MNNLAQARLSAEDPRPVDSAAQPTGQSAQELCQRCGEAPTQWVCTPCAVALCEPCFELLHKAAKKREHARVAARPTIFLAPDTKSLPGNLPADPSTGRSAPKGILSLLSNAPVWRREEKLFG